MGRHHTKTDVVVEVVDVVVVAVGATRVPLIIVEGTTAQHSGVDRSAPSQMRHWHYTRKLGKYPRLTAGGFCLSILLTKEKLWNQNSEIQKTEFQNLSGENRRRHHTKTDAVVEEEVV